MALSLGRSDGNFQHHDAYAASRTDSSRSTMRGIGSDTGKALLALGILVLRGVEVLEVNLSLRRFNNEVREFIHGFKSVSSSTLEALLDIVRMNFYSPLAKRRVWSILIAAIQTEAVADKVWIIIRNQWEPDDVQRFLQYLGIIKLSVMKENLSPKSLISIRGLREASNHRDCRSLVWNACQLFCAIVQRDDPSMMLRTFAPDIVRMLLSFDDHPPERSRDLQRLHRSSRTPRKDPYPVRHPGFQLILYRA